MQIFRNFTGIAAGAACLALTVLLFASGCGMGGSLDAKEAPVKQFVESKGGMVEVENSHIVTVWLESAGLQNSDLDQFASLPELKHLHLNYNGDLTNEVFATAEKMPKLETLELTETKITNGAADKFRDTHPQVSISGPGA
ncbi:hypothetical protein [Bremerella cremea]|uniref:hypothetical protein n=1 Tax=Bremerella cremea TaxID=1031537 RepID=UPI0031E972F9